MSELHKNIRVTNKELLDLRTYAIEKELETIHILNHILEMSEEEGHQPWQPGKGHQFHLASKIVEFILNGSVDPDL